MKLLLALLICSSVFAVDVTCDWSICNNTFIRGDSNQDGSLNISDSITILNFLFQGGPEPCLEASDVDDDGSVLLTDSVYITDYLFLAGPPPPAPFPTADLVACHCLQDQGVGCDECVNPGDINQDGIITSSGAIVNGVFCPACPGDRDLLIIFLNTGARPICLEPADIDWDNDVDGDDLLFLDNYLFRSGPEPCCQHKACWCSGPFCGPCF